MKEKRSPWLLDGKEEVREFLNGASDHKLKKWINAGMPVLIDKNNCWVAHTKNIEDWFQAYTCRRSSFEGDPNGDFKH